MSLYVHLHVVIPANENYTLAFYAKDHLRYYNRDDCIEARWFLNELSNRTGSNPGSKGGLSLWGIIGNATHPDVFVEVLRPFWERVLRAEPHDGERILVFYHKENEVKASAYSIYFDEQELVVDHHELPLSFRFNY